MNSGNIYFKTKFENNPKINKISLKNLYLKISNYFLLISVPI